MSEFDEIDVPDITYPSGRQSRAQFRHNKNRLARSFASGKRPTIVRDWHKRPVSMPKLKCLEQPE